MTVQSPSNALEVRHVIEARLAALDSIKGAQETVTVEWRGAQRPIPVISMPVNLGDVPLRVELKCGDGSGFACYAALRSVVTTWGLQWRLSAAHSLRRSR